MYSEPTSELPSAVAKLIRCVSPPLSVLACLSNVRYPSPTSRRHPKRVVSSIMIRRDTDFSRASNCSCNCSTNGRSSSIGIDTSSAMFRPPTRTHSASRLRRWPWHSGHSARPEYWAIITLFCTLWYCERMAAKYSSIPCTSSPSPFHRSCRWACVSWLYGRCTGKS